MHIEINLVEMVLHSGHLFGGEGDMANVEVFHYAASFAATPDLTTAQFGPGHKTSQGIPVATMTSGAFSAGTFPDFSQCSICWRSTPLPIAVASFVGLSSNSARACSIPDFVCISHLFRKVVCSIEANYVARKWRKMICYENSR